MAEPRSRAHLAYGQALRERREATGVSQETLARTSGLDRTYVSGIERGERNPSLANLLRLAAALDVPLSQIALAAERRLRLS